MYVWFCMHLTWVQLLHDAVLLDEVLQFWFWCNEENSKMTLRIDERLHKQILYSRTIKNEDQLNRGKKMVDVAAVLGVIQADNEQDKVAGWQKRGKPVRLLWLSKLKHNINKIKRSQDFNRH
jgi:hypothetical protein